MTSAFRAISWRSTKAGACAGRFATGLALNRSPATYVTARIASAALVAPSPSRSSSQRWPSRSRAEARRPIPPPSPMAESSAVNCARLVEHAYGVSPVSIRPFVSFSLALWTSRHGSLQSRTSGREALNLGSCFRRELRYSQNNLRSQCILPSSGAIGMVQPLRRMSPNHSSSGRPPASFACFQSPLMSNVRHPMRRWSDA